MSDFCAPSRLKSATCRDKLISDRFKCIETGCHLSRNISFQVLEPSFKASKYINRSGPFLCAATWTFFALRLTMAAGALWGARAYFYNDISDTLKPQHALPAELIRAHHQTSNRPPNPRLKRIVISCRGAIAASIPVVNWCPCEGVS
jgi:hypothetical protein